MALLLFVLLRLALIFIPAVIIGLSVAVVVTSAARKRLREAVDADIADCRAAGFELLNQTDLDEYTSGAECLSIAYNPALDEICLWHYRSRGKDFWSIPFIEWNLPRTDSKYSVSEKQRFESRPGVLDGVRYGEVRTTRSVYTVSAHLIFSFKDGREEIRVNMNHTKKDWRTIESRLRDWMKEVGEIRRELFEGPPPEKRTAPARKPKSCAVCGKASIVLARVTYERYPDITREMCLCEQHLLALKKLGSGMILKTTRPDYPVGKEIGKPKRLLPSPADDAGQD